MSSSSFIVPPPSLVAGIIRWGHKRKASDSAGSPRSLLVRQGSAPIVLVRPHNLETKCRAWYFFHSIEINGVNRRCRNAKRFPFLTHLRSTLGHGPQLMGVGSSRTECSRKSQHLGM